MGETAVFTLLTAKIPVKAILMCSIHECTVHIYGNVDVNNIQESIYIIIKQSNIYFFIVKKKYYISDFITSNE